MDYLEEIREDEFVVVVTDENKYSKVLYEILKKIEKTSWKICYVCLNKTYEDVKEYMKKNKINVDNIIFVDTLSSHYQMRKSTSNCVFVSSPSALDEIQENILKLVERGCKLVLFDTISTLLIYKQPENVVRFTNNLMTMIKKRTKGIIYIYVIIKINHILKNENRELVSDLAMFAEKVFNLTKDESLIKIRA